LVEGENKNRQPEIHAEKLVSLNQSDVGSSSVVVEKPEQA